MGREVNPKRGEIYLVNFDPTVGSEIKKTRPALILQNNIGNQYSAVTIVAAITSFGGGRLYPTEVKLEKRKGLQHDSAVLLNQIRTVDKQRLLKKLGTVGGESMEQVNVALLVGLGFIEQWYGYQTKMWQMRKRVNKIRRYSAESSR